MQEIAKRKVSGLLDVIIYRKNIVCRRAPEDIIIPLQGLGLIFLSVVWWNGRHR